MSINPQKNTPHRFTQMDTDKIKNEFNFISDFICVHLCESVGKYPGVFEA
jgi:hypothetical protein